MRLGPVFWFEMKARSRRKEPFVIRCTYGLLLLLVFTIQLSDMPGLSKSSELPPSELTGIAARFVTSILILQAGVVLIITPPLVAGTLAKDRERGNLDLLMQTPISSSEIILGKLFAPLYELAIMIVVAVPILCILSLMGGMDVGDIVFSAGLLLTTASLVAAYAILISTLSTHPRRAIWSTYLVVAGCTAFPLLTEFAKSLGKGLFFELGGLAEPIEELVYKSNPLYIFTSRGKNPSFVSYNTFATMLVQIGIATGLTFIASIILRPLVKENQQHHWPWAPAKALFSKRTLLPRPSCGEFPMIWKEFHVARSILLFRLLWLVATTFIAVPLAIATWSYSLAALEELQLNGYGSNLGVTLARDQFNGFLRMILVCLYILAALRLAVCTATSITSEKEASTWTSLLTLPMDAEEILAGKLFGAFATLRWLGLVYLAFLALGLAFGAIHPLAGCYSILLVAALMFTVGVLGLWFSMTCRSSTRAVTATILSLLVVNILPAFWESATSQLPIALASMSPVLLTLSLASFQDVDQLSRTSGSFQRDALPLLVCGFFFYWAAALALWKLCVGHFDVSVDRPRLNAHRGKTSPRGILPEIHDEPPVRSSLQANKAFTCSKPESDNPSE